MDSNRRWGPIRLQEFIVLFVTANFFFLVFMLSGTSNISLLTIGVYVFFLNCTFLLYFRARHTGIASGLLIVVWFSHVYLAPLPLPLGINEYLDLPFWTFLALVAYHFWETRSETDRYTGIESDESELTRLSLDR